MSFGAPAMFWLMGLVPLLLALHAWDERRRRELVARLVASRLAEDLAGSADVALRRVRVALLALGLALGVAALARPQVGFEWEQQRQKGRDVLVAVDVSKSMLANDLAPSRLARARFAVRDLAGMLEGDRAGIIAFAGSAFLQVPLTVDRGALGQGIDVLEPGIIPLGGTNIAAAIGEAREAFGKGESDQRALVIFTDGEELSDDAVKAAERAAESMRIFTVGVGSDEGSIIPLGRPGESGGFVKDAKGQYVKSRLDEGKLRQIAEAAGGFYQRLDSGPAAMRRIVADGLAGLREKENEEVRGKRPIERFQWPLAASALCVLLAGLVGERRAARRGAGVAARGIGAALLWCAAAGEAGGAEADGMKLYEEGKYGEALEAFEARIEKTPESPLARYNAGTAAYGAGDFGLAADRFSGALAGAEGELLDRSQFNLGNSLFKRGQGKEELPERLKDWEEAERHYGGVLERLPDHAKAKTNLEILRKEIEKLKEQMRQEQREKERQKQDPQQEKKEEKEKQKDQNQKDQNQQDQQQKQESGQQDPQNQQDSSGKQDPQQGQQQEQSQQQGDQQKQEPGERQEGSGQQQQGQQGQPGDQGKREERDGGQGATPTPAPTPDRKREGEVGPAEGEQPKEGGQPAETGEAQPVEAVREGEMTEGQAVQLIEALRGEEARVLLQERRAGRQDEPLKDW